MQRIEDPHHPRGYRELRSPAEMRKLLNRKIVEQHRKCAICHEEFTDFNDIVPDHRDPKKEVKALIASAKTKEDHLKLADYYKAETERLEAEAKNHDEMAEMYRKNPTPMAVKHPEAIGEGQKDR